MTYEAVFWDVGGVLVDLRSVREGYASFLADLCEEYDLPYERTVEEWRSTLGDHFAAREGTEFRSAREGYVAATTAVFDGEAPDVSEWWPLFESATAAAMRPEPSAVGAVRTLDEAGVYQAVVSDIDDRELETILDTFDLRDCFAQRTTSERVGCTKPDPRMFADALEAWAGDPGEGVMVGDRYEHDVEAASAAGLDAVAYGEDAAGPAADHVVDDLVEVPPLVTGEGD